MKVRERVLRTLATLLMLECLRMKVASLPLSEYSRCEASQSKLIAG
jgi:hypothetical protein